jgi:hypothetical protein
MVNSRYFYDIISTMFKRTVDKILSVSKRDKSKLFVVERVSIPELTFNDTTCSKFTLNITLDRVKRFVGRGCPIEFFTILINSMMNIGATITKDRFGHVSVVVDTFKHMKPYIDSAIMKMIDRSFFTDLSFNDAREIISRLKLEEYLYCIEGHESGVCFVVLGPNFQTQNPCLQPWYLFEQEVLKVNESRTIVMSSEQEERLIKGSEEFSTLVEFRSAIDKNTSKVLFKREDPNIPIIRQVLKVEMLTTQLFKEEMELENMKQLKEMLELQKRMFPLTQPQL